VAPAGCRFASLRLSAETHPALRITLAVLAVVLFRATLAGLLTVPIGHE